MKRTILSEKVKKGLAAILKNWELYLLFLPTFLYVLLLHYLPIGGLIMSFQDYNAYQGLWGSPWAGMGGFAHFVTFVTLPNFWQLIGNTLVLSVLSILLNSALPLILALFINEICNKIYKKVVMTISYAPYFVSTVVLVGMLFTFSGIETGVFNRIVEAFGGNPVSFMERKEYFVPMYLLSGLWQGLGWWSIVYVSALSSVDECLHEAAVLDGAGRFQRIWHINIPSILPMAVTMFIISLGNMLSVGFEKVYLMQTSGNLGVSEIISTYVYRISFGAGIMPQYSLAAAIGLFNSVINIILLITANAISRKVSETSLW